MIGLLKKEVVKIFKYIKNNDRYHDRIKLY